LQTWQPRISYIYKKQRVKNLITVFGLLSFLILSSCSSSSNARVSTSDKAEVNYTSLADFLRRHSSVSVKGVDPDIRLQIRGVNSLTSDTRPFIYIDKNPIGRDYSRANNAVNPNNIKRVEVISSLAELTRYGQEGHSGVIRVHTKTNSSD